MAEDGITDEELEAELQREIEAELAAKAAQEAALNVTNSMNQSTIENATTILGDSGSATPATPGGAQLTTFQDNIITTGSDVSILLMVLLLILFIVQMIRKTYQHFTHQSLLRTVENPLDSARPMSAENLNPMNPNYSHSVYAVYNTEFEERKLYLLKKGEGAPRQVLQELLLKRAIKCIEKARAIQRDGQGIRKNWNMDLLPREVWHDYQAAQRNLNLEIENVVQESKASQFQWGPKHRDNIFSQAREFHDKKVAVQNKVFQQKMMRQKQANQMAKARANGQPPTGPGARAPNAKSFGNGLSSGFFNSPPNEKGPVGSPNANGKKKLSKKERKAKRKEEKDLKKQQAQMKRTPSMQQGSLENAEAQGSTVRRRKPKHRFTK